jgi:hypothetical protein
VVERLDHPRARQVAGDQLRGRRALVVELGDLAVALRVVVAGVDDDLAGQRLRGQLVDRLQRHGDDGEVAGSRGLLRRPRPGAALRRRTVVDARDEVLEGLGAP